jgi:hypothetical protein
VSSGDLAPLIGGFGPGVDADARNITKVAGTRRLLTLVYYGLRDGQIRCLSEPAWAA